MAAIIAMFAACENNEAIPEIQEEIINNKTAADYTITIEEAVAELTNVLDFIDNQTSGKNGNKVSSKKRTITDIGIIYQGKKAPKKMSYVKGMQKAPQQQALLYVVDFEDNEGSAVLSADKRIPEPVLAITETGSIWDTEQPVYNEETGYNGMKIEGFSLYNETENDYYVAGISHPLDYCQQYAEFRLMDDPYDPYYGGGSGGSSGSNNTVVRTETGDWVQDEKITPKLTTVWHQREPFNDAIPTSRWSFLHSYKRGPAGCVAIALAQIMAYHEYPANLKVNEYLVDWKGVKDICNISNSTAYGTTYNRTAVAQLVANIGAWCSMLYKPDFGFALPRKARDCMNTYGYGNAVRHYGYDKSQVINMLQKDNPVFIASISGLVGGHAWVIDGYIKQIRTIKRYNAAGVVVSSTPQTQDLMHCNFGWNGYCNGYYTSGIFNLKNGPEDREKYEEKWGKGDTDHFNWAFHIITYNNPN